MKKLFVVLLCLSVLGAAACKSSSPKAGQEQGNVDLGFDLETEVPPLTDHFQIVGVDDSGKVIYGPVYLPKSAQVMLSGVPTGVARIQVTFLLGTTPLGTTSAPVDLSNGAAMVNLGQMAPTEVERLELLSVAPLSAEVAVQGVQDFRVTGRFSDGASYDLTAAATWISSSPLVASVEANGIARGLTPGVSSITATVAEVTSAPATLTVTPPVEPSLLPTVASVDPKSGPTTGATLVTIVGTNLDGATAVSFGGTAALSFVVDSATQITATAPARIAGTVHVQVSTPAGTSALTTADEFRFFSVPAITNLSPKVGAQAGGDTVVITGSGFTDATSVRFGGNAARSFTVDSDTQVTAVSPAGAGSVGVQVGTANGMSTLSFATTFVYLPIPRITGLSAANGPETGGNPVVISGVDLDRATEVRFGGNLASFTIDAATQLTAIAPAGIGTVQVVVRTPGGNSETLDYAYLPIPSLTSLAPSGGPQSGANEITLTGGSLAQATQVMFGETPATTFTVVSETEITAVAPAGTGIVKVMVWTPGGNSNVLDYTYAAPAVLSNIAPTSGPEAGGNPVTISGTGLAGAISVAFGVAEVSSFTVVSDTELTVVAPAGSGSVAVSVLTVSGVSNTLPYQYAPIPALTGLMPDAGPEAGGTLVTLLGSGFAGATKVTFGTAEASSLSVFSDTQLSAIAPPGVGLTEVTVITAQGTSNPFPFKYLPPPTLALLTPEQGPEGGGNTVTLTGAGFVRVSSVSFGADSTVPFSVLSETEIKATAPVGSEDVPVHVTTPGGVSGDLTYRYVPGPSLISVDPSSGPEAGGNTVTLAGRNFADVSGVQFGATPAASFTVASTSEIRAVAPAGAGVVDISVVAQEQSSNVVPYTFVALPQVYDVAPATGPALGGNWVTLTGVNLAGTTEVHFGAIPAAAFTVNADTEIVALASPGVGVVDVTVTTAGGVSDGVPYVYVASEQTVLVSITPANGLALGGNTVTLLGAQLSGVTAVNFGATPAASFAIVSETQITAVAPAGTGTVQVAALTAAGSTNALPYTYDPAGTLSSIAPSQGPEAGGNVVTLVGTRLTGATAVNFGLLAATAFTVESDSQITATVPAGTGVVDVTVATAGGPAGGVSYTYVAAPTVAELSASAGPQAGGNTLTITGSGFVTTTGVSFGSAAATFSVLSDTQISVTVPAGSGTTNVTVTTAGGTSTGVPYTYAPVPSVGSLSASAGPEAGGNTLTITGSGFNTTSGVSFGATAATFTVLSDTQLSVTVPAGTGAVDVTVTSAGGTSSGVPYTYAAVPTLTSVTPSSGVEAGGNAVTISGSGLAGASAVQFGATPAASFSVVSDSQITATVPAGTGSAALTVTTPGGSASGASYTYVSLPTIASVSPVGGPLVGGNAVTIVGTGLSTVTQVLFGVLPATITSSSDAQIVVTAPAGAGVVDVTVTTVGGSATDVAAYAYISLPLLAAVVPNAGPVSGGNTVTITGVNLAGALAATFDGVPGTIVSNTPTQLDVVVPAGTEGEVSVVVSTVGGLSDVKTYTFVAVPVLTSVTPAVGPQAGGNTVILEGTDLATTDGVFFGSSAASFTVVSDGELSVTAPAGSGVVDVVVETAGGTAISASGYEYVAVPTLMSVSPSAGPQAGGNTLTIAGSGLATATGVSFDGTPASFTVVSDSQLSVTAPAGTGTASVTVTTAGGTSSGVSYTYVAIPTVGSLSASSGPQAGGNTLIITGSGFNTTSGVSFGGTPATFTVISDTQIVVTVPAGTGAVNVTVTTAGGTSSGTPYTYASVPTLTSVSPSSGVEVGANTVAINGTGLTGASAVSFGATPAASFSVLSDSQITATVPAGTGTVALTVTTPGGSAGGASYTYVSVPSITSVSPVGGPVVGGNAVAITGTALSTATQVLFGTTPASITSSTETQLVVTAPPGTGVVDVVVVTVGGSATAAAAYAYVASPLLAAVVPNAGPVSGGNTVTITGVNLAGALAATFDGVPGTIVSNTPTQLDVVVPAGTEGEVSVVVSTVGGLSDVKTYTFVAVPVLTSVTPAVGPQAGGNTVTVEGTDLTTTDGVFFGSSAASFTVVSDGELSVTVPAGSGVVDVVVETAGGTATSTSAYQYVAVPTLTSVSPSAGPQAGGNTLTIAGSGLATATGVSFGGTPATFTVVSDSQLSVTAPAGTGAASVTVTTAGGTSSGVSYIYAPIPTVGSLSATAGPLVGGNTLTIAGSGFNTTSSVSFGGSPAVFTVLSDSQIVVTVPAGTGAVSVTVTTAGGTSSGTPYTYASVPTLTGVTPSSGVEVGANTVTINGTGLTGASAVSFGATPAASFSVLSDSQITATVPAGTGTAALTVTTPGGTASGASYTYVSVPTITSVSPVGGPVVGGNAVTITGTALSTATQVLFGATPASVTSSTDTQLVVTAPPGTGVVDVVVVTVGGSATASAAYAYVSSPLLAALVPNAGLPAGGNTVTITGVNLAGALAVTFDGALATIVSNTPTQLQVIAPAGTEGDVSVVVSTIGGLSDVKTYTYAVEPLLSSVTPSAGPTAGGNTVSLAGTDFTLVNDVLFDGVSASFTNVSDGEITATAPAGAAGAVDVVVQSIVGSSTLAGGYTYVAAPALATPSPQQGPLAGGNTITLTGTNLAGATAVSFGSTPATFSIISPTQISATAPAGTGTVSVTVTTAGGASNGVSYSYEAAPTLATLSASVGPQAGGNTLTLTGSGFTSASTVSFGTTSATFSVVSDSQITTTAPAGTGSASVTVTAAGGTSNGLSYTYVAVPSVTSLSASAGPAAGGNTLTLTGSGFSTTTAVSFGGTPASFSVVSDTQLTATAPAGTGPVSITVTTAGGTSSGVAYTYAAVPTLTSVSPASGAQPGGSTVTINGTGLTGASAVNFGATPASSFVVVSDSQITATVPAGTGTAGLTVTTPGGTASGASYAYVSAPSITSVSPAGGPVIGGNAVTITGTALSTATQVLFDTTPASITSSTDTQLVVTAPAGTGLADVTVVTVGGSATASAAYAYVSSPLLAAVVPNAGLPAGGNTVTITGVNLAGALAVTFDGALATIVSNTPTQLQVIAPAGTEGEVSVVVSTIGGLSDVKTYTYAVAPLLSSATPSTGPEAGGNSVTLAGTDFTLVNDVLFDGVSASFTIVSDGEITATAPAGAAGAVDVVVQSIVGSSTLAGGYTYVAAPALATPSPQQGPLAGGNTITLTGTNLAGATAVSFGSTPATFSIISPTQISATAPAGTGTVSVTVTTAGGASNGVSYSYAAAPTLTTLSASAGPQAGGNLVTLTGSGFSTASAVEFGGSSASFSIVSDTQITATAPAGTGSVSVSVEAAGGTSSAQSYVYIPSPTLSSLSASTGPEAGGNSLTLTGSSLATATAVSFGGTPASFSVVSDSQITATVPAGTGTVNVVVTTAGGTSSASVYTYVVVPTVTSVSPSNGPEPGGNTITITGAGFAGASAVSFDAVAAASFVVDSSTQITATVPAGAGSVAVTVTTPGGTAGGATYTYVAAPTLATLTPAGGPVTGGNTVTIVGTALATVSQVLFDGTPGTISANTDTQIDVVAPAGSGAVDVVVVTVGGSATEVGAYTYVSSPLLAAVIPNAGPTAGGNTLTITGVNLANALSVTFDGTLGTIVGNTPTQVQVVAPAGSEGDVSVVVSTLAGPSDVKTYAYVDPPNIINVTPAAGAQAGGNTVTVTGSDFLRTANVQFGSNAASFTVVSDTELSVVAPAGTGTVDLLVETPAGTATVTGGYTYVVTPTAASLSATSGPAAGGNTVTITGSGLATTSAVSFGGTPASFSVVSATQLSVTVPAGTGAVSVTVTTVGGTSSGLTYTYVSTPNVTGLSPSSAAQPGGNTVTISGTNLTGATAVMFGATPASAFTVLSSTQINAVAPGGSGAVSVTVTTPSGTSTGVTYTYVPQPTVTSLSPSSGPPAGGTSVTITGTNLTGTTAVWFGATEATSFTVVSATQITAVAPAGTGSALVTVSTAGGPGSGPSFTYQVPGGVITTVAGQMKSSCAAAPCGDGSAATAASLYSPSGLAIDPSNHVYIAEFSNHAVRKIDRTTGIITTFAGAQRTACTTAPCGDGGLATAARLNGPRGAASDAAGNIYIADFSNHAIRRVDKVTGIITTVAGTIRSSCSTSPCGDGGLATSAQLNSPTNLAFDAAGNMFIADYGNHVIRRVDATTRVITTVMGTMRSACSSAPCGDGGLATAAQMNGPSTVAVDSSNNVYVSEYGSHAIRRMDGVTRIISTYAGTLRVSCSVSPCGDGGAASSATLTSPFGVTVDASDNVYIADSSNAAVRRVDKATGIITTVAGIVRSSCGTIPCGEGGPATSAQLSNPFQVRLDSTGVLYILEYSNQILRKVQ